MPGFRTGRRPAGQNVFGCLVMICVLIAAGIWAYYTYVHNYTLKHAGEKITTIADAEPDTRLEYLRRMRDRSLSSLGTISKDLRDFIGGLKKGKYTEAESFKRKVSGLETQMREEIGVLNSMGVPKEYLPLQKNAVLALRDFFYALEEIRKIPGAETAEQKKKLLENATALDAKGRKKLAVAREYREKFALQGVK